MYIRALLEVQGIRHGTNHGLMAYANLIWKAQSIFQYLDEIEEVIADFEWHIVALDVEDIEFHVSVDRFLEQEYVFYTHRGH